MSVADQNKITEPQRKTALSLFDCICIIVGTIIGAGIFATPGDVASKLSSIEWVIGIWLIGGGIALIGSFCFAELTTRYQQPGGDYAYLKLGYGRQLAFAFSWAAFWIIRPGNIGAMAMIFGLNADQIWSWGPYSQLGYALLIVTLLSATNLLGLKFGTTVQNSLTVVKVLGILMIVAAAAFLIPEQAAETADESQTPNPAVQTDFWLAMVFVMFAYGGWNDIAFVAVEAKNPRKNLFRSLMLGTGVVIFIYLLVNLALAYGLGFEQFASAGTQATNQIMELAGWGNRFLAAIICFSCAGAINGMIFTSPRIYAATAVDYPRLRWLSGATAESKEVAGTTSQSGWWRAMLLQTVVTILLMIECGRRTEVDAFQTILVCTAVFFWFFLALTVLALVVCRFRVDQKPLEGFRLSRPWFPLFPLAFAIACGFMVYRSWSWMMFNKLWILTSVIGVWMLIGVGLSFLLGKPSSSDQKQRS